MTNNKNTNPRGKMPGIERKVQRSSVAPSSSGLTDAHLSFAKAMIDPVEYESSATLAPGLIPTRCSTVVERLQAKISNGSFVIEAAPRPYNTLAYTSSTALGPVDSLSGQSTTTKPSSGNAYSSLELGEYHSGEVAVPLSAAAIGAAAGPWFPLSSILGGNLNFSVSETTQSAQMRVAMVTAAGVISYSTSMNPSKGGAASVGITVPANFAGFRLEVRYVVSSAASFGCSFTILPSTALLEFVGVQKIKSLKTLSSVKQLRWWRIVGQAIRVYYTGSELNSGGDIAAAEVYAGWTPNPGESTYEALARLPTGMSYVGRVRDGAHVFYRPASIRDLDPILYDTTTTPQAPLSKRLVVAGTLDDPTQSVNIELATIVQFMTDDPAYPSSHWSVPFHGFDMVLLALSEMNPASENPLHLRKVKKLMLAKVKEAIRWGIEHPEQVAAAAAKVAALLAI